MSRDRLLIIGLVAICVVCVGIALYATTSTVPGSSPVVLTVMMPYDQGMSSTLTHLATDYGKSHTTQINLISVKGRQAMVDEILSGNQTPDLIIIEKQYPLFNLTGLETLLSGGFVVNSDYLYTTEAVLVVPQGSAIHSLADISGKRVAMVNQTKYAAPGGCLAGYIVADANASVTPFMVSGVPEAYAAVANSSADATSIWMSDYSMQQARTGDNLSEVPLPQYGMDNYIVLLKTSGHPKEAASFMDYIVAHKDAFGNT
ncbi:hypothetical protein Mboo_2372 [Methanoregula boonei 6A8]|uniref:Uncharacterized protein n=1 Tax=Methanoregula boonei (strain DSM 21154 / JCM 14090 / 6A8) TaxID=456442 RepID=A7IAX5_METB6|nr:substrate-binding domain-containing protein [Methanoregula boonei]ABS56886.1 hypothetical protein Mboo_2372 [Methanoregula boonei 6A8]